MPKDYHKDPESLARRVAKLDAANQRLRSKHRLLKTEAVERAAKLQELWGILTDIRAEIILLRPDGEPGEWRSLVETVHAVVQDYVNMEDRLKKVKEREAEHEAEVDALQDKLEYAEGSVVGAFGTLFSYLRRKLRKIISGA